MAVQTPVSLTSTGAVIALGTLDSAIINANVILFDTDGLALTASGIEHFVILHGSLTGASSGMMFTAPATGDHRIEVVIGETGILQSLGDNVADTALRLEVNAGTTNVSTHSISNSGYVFARNIGIIVDNTDATASELVTINNTGTIEAYKAAIKGNGSSLQLVINNHGSIQTLQPAIFSSTPSALDFSSATNAATNIVLNNSGLIDGSYLGSGGADKLDNTGGTIIGTVFLGSGSDLYRPGIATIVDGATGVDTLDFGRMANGVVFALDDSLTSVGGAFVSTNFSNFENLEGSNGNDTLRGNGSDNQIDGNLGNDVLEGLAGVDQLFGGSGNDILRGGVDGDTLVGDAGDDVLDGSSGVDTLLGDSGNDTLDGGSDNDTLDGGSGQNILRGGSGNDLILRTSESLTAVNSNQIDGGSGVDVISYSGLIADIALALDGSFANTGRAQFDSLANIENIAIDEMAAFIVNAKIAGNNLANSISVVLSSGDATIFGRGGNDIISPFFSSISGWAIDGGTGSDTLDLSLAGASTVALASGSILGALVTSIENLRIGNGAWNVTGTVDNNVFSDKFGELTADIFVGAGGSDTVSYEFCLGLTTGLLAGDTRTNEAIGDTYASIENLTGGASTDDLKGDDNANILRGLNSVDVLTGRLGNDTLMGGGAGDTLNGDGGADIASYADATSAVKVSLDNTIVKTGDAVGDIFTSIESLTGSAFNDTLVGNAGANVLRGGGGTDVLNGKLGADTLIGGLGIDTLNGGGVGLDKFQFNAIVECGDVIQNFDAADQIVLEGSAFGLGAFSGPCPVTRFVSRALDNFASTPDQRFIFNQANDQLWYDSNGSLAAGVRVLIADFTNNFNLTAADIVIV